MAVGDVIAGSSITNAFSFVGTSTFTGATGVTGQFSVTNNAAAIRVIGTDHCFVEYYPDGVAAGRKAYHGIPNSTTASFRLVNQESGTGSHFFLNYEEGIGALFIPRHTSAQRDALTDVENGMVIYNSTTSLFNVYRSGAWYSVNTTGPL